MIPFPGRLFRTDGLHHPVFGRHGRENNDAETVSAGSHLHELMAARAALPPPGTMWSQNSSAMP